MSKLIFTSNYVLNGTNPLAFSVSRFVPDNYKGNRLIQLAPEWELVRLIKKGEINELEYTRRYLKDIKSRKINFQTLVDELPNGSLLICYEPPDDFCHRHILADIINKSTDATCIEWTSKANQEMQAFDLLSF